MVFDTVAGMIAKQLKMDVKDITPDKRLVEDLKADSANVMVMIMDLEDTFNLTVDDTAINTLRTVGDVVKYIEAHQYNRQAILIACLRMKDWQASLSFADINFL